MPSDIRTETQAYPRAEQHIQTAVADMGTAVRLRPGLRNAILLDAELTAHPTTANVEIAYDCLLPDPEDEDVFTRNLRCFERLEAALIGNGYRILTRQFTPPFCVLRALDEADGFTISLKQGKIGNLWITASSPAVERTDVTPPPPALA